MLSRQSRSQRTQVGSGISGDKRRKYPFRDDSVYDSVTGKECRCSDAVKGMVELLW
jgi:hypothetical protein